MRGFIEQLIDKFNNINNTGAQLQYSIYHMTLKVRLFCDFPTKSSRFRQI